MGCGCATSGAGGCSSGGCGGFAGGRGGALWLDTWVPLAPGANWYLPPESFKPVGNIMGTLATIEVAAVGPAASEGLKLSLTFVRTAAATARTEAYELLAGSATDLGRTLTFAQVGFGPGETTTVLPKGFAGFKLRNTSATNYACVHVRAWLALQTAG